MSSSSIPQVFIVHGYNGSPDKNWFPWLKGQLEDLHISAISLAMPHPERPEATEWLSYLQDQIHPPTDHTFLVGHSLGCIALLRYLEQLNEGQQIGGTIVVAGFSTPIHFHELDDFVLPELNYDLVKKHCPKIICISSDNDEHVPLTQATYMAQALNAEQIIYPHGGHLNQKSGFTEFPLVLEKLLSLIKS